MTYYQLLDIPPDAEQALLKPAYFAALRKYPPEQYPQEFQALRHAYEVLSDAKTRAQYDTTLQMTEGERTDYQRAKSLYDRSEHAAAIQILTEEGEPASELALVLLGECYAENGNSQKAAKIFESLLAQNPANTTFLIRLGQCYADRGWDKKAEAVFRRAVAADEGEVSGWLSLIQLSDPKRPETQALIDTALAACNRHDSPTLALLKYALVIAAVNECAKIADYVAQVAAQMSKSCYSDEMWRHFGEEASPFLIHYFMSQLQAEEPVDFVALKVMLEQAFSFLTEEACGESFGVLQKIETMFALITDAKISDFMEELLNAAAADDTTALETIGLELYCLLNLETHRAELQYLKRAHPGAYAWKKSFFDLVLQTANTGKLIEKYEAKMSCLVKGNPEEARDMYGDSDLPEKQTPIVRTEPKVGRNDPCPCGSGKKYKKCCGG